MRTARWLSVERDGVLLKCLDHGGDGPPVLVLHGLAGHAREWDRTASWLSGGHRVLALDQRGHGGSDRRPADVSRTAFVEDVVAVVEQLELGRVVLVGQSLGGHTALLTAARHPDLVTALVVVEAWPGGDPDTPEEIAAWLAGWPVPFRSRQAAVEFFTGEFGPAGDVASAWADGLEQRDGGWWPRFDNVTGLIQPTRKYERRRVFFAEIESGFLSSGATHGAGSGSARPPSDSARAGRWRRSRTTRSAKPSSLPPLWLGADRLIDANGKMNTARGLAEMAGPSIGGFIVGMVGAARAVTTDAASYLVSAATLTSMRFREPEPTPRGQETRFRTELAEGLGFVLRQPVLRALSPSGAITTFLLRGVGSLWLLYVIRDLHWSVRAAGLVYGLSLAGGVAGSVAAKSVVSRIGMGPAMILGALLSAPFELVTPLVSPGLAGQWIVALVFTSLTAAGMIYATAAGTARQLLCPPDMLGRMNRSSRFLQMGLLPLGPLAAGGLGTWIGLRPALPVLAGATLPSPVILSVSPVRTMREIQADQAYERVGS